MAELAPNESRIAAMGKVAKMEGPFVMLNLLRFRAQALYDAGSDTTPCTGAEAFRRYGEGAAPVLSELGARAIYSGTGILSLIAPAEEEWDAIALVEYPSWSAFMELGTRPDYQAIAFHRPAALVDSRLIITRPNEVGLG